MRTIRPIEAKASKAGDIDGGSHKFHHNPDR